MAQGEKKKSAWNLQEIYKVKCTKDYYRFKLVDGNRNIEHARTVGKSIDEIGLLPIPIIVNERFEIYDGQGRFEACKQRNLPIYYMMISGLTVGVIRKLNSTSTKWKVQDYIHSYTSGEDKTIDYVYLENLQKQFPEFGNVVITSAVGGYGNSGGHYASKIRKGEFTCTVEQYEDAVKILTWLKPFAQYVKQVGGRTNYLYTALIWCYQNESVDNDYLFEKFQKRYMAINEIATEKAAIAEIQEKVYNFNLRSNRDPVYLISEYEKYKKLCKANAKESA